jgi:hypothetical protein
LLRGKRVGNAMWGRYVIGTSLAILGIGIASAEEPKAPVTVPKVINLTVPTIKKGMGDQDKSNIQALTLHPRAAPPKP